MGDNLVYIEIYVRDNLGGVKVGYECVDNDKSILFSPYMFSECLREWAHDTKNIIPLPIEELNHRLSVFQTKAVVPSDIVAKIKNLIKFVENNKDIYASITLEGKKMGKKSQQIYTCFLNKYVDRARQRRQPSQSIRTSQRCVSNTLLQQQCQKRTAHTDKCWVHLAKQNNLQIKPSNVICGGNGLFAWKNPYHMVRLYQNIRVGKKPKHKSIENMVMLVPITQYAIVKGIVLMQIILPMPRHVL
jgi:hypothetical protein